MNRRLPPNLWERQYKTRGGYKRTRYYARFRDWKGKRRTISLGEDFTEAKEELSRLKALNRRRHDFDKPLIPDSLSHWIDKLIALKAGKPIAVRHGYSAKPVKEFFGETPLSEVTKTRMMEYRAQRPVSVATVNRELALIRAALIMAHGEGVLKSLPEIPLEEEHNERVRTASDIEYRRVLNALNQGDRDFAEVIREMGFRPQDIHRITPADIDFENRAIDMKRIRSKFGHKRPLPLSPRAWAILSRRAEGLGKNDILFPFSRHRIRTAWSRACAKLGIKDLWLYDLKATFCTEKLRQGWPEKVISEFTGHKSTAAFRRYARPTMDDLRAFIGHSKASKLQHSGNTDEQRNAGNDPSA